MATQPLVVLKLTQGQSEDFFRATPNSDGTYGGVFTGTEVITYTVWPADSEAVALSSSGAPNQWINAAQSQWLISFSDAQTATLQPGPYEIEVTAAVAPGRTATLFRGQLEVFSAAGTAAPDDLITATYAAKMLAGLGITPQAIEKVPDLISATSDAIRKFCRRRFTQATYIETVEVSLYGIIRLSQIPVQRIQRIQCLPGRALTVANPSPSVQQAWIYCNATGDSLTGFTLTNMVLNWTSNGVPGTQSVPIAAGQTIAGLAAAINAVGSGWTATADLELGLYPAAEIMDGLDSRGAGPNDRPQGGAVFHVYASNVTNARPLADGGMETGMIQVGWIPAGGFDGRWGGWGDRDDSDRQGQTGRVRATYVGGFATVPLDIQRACAELVKLQLERLKTDMMLRGEHGGLFSYEINNEMLMSFPPYVRNALKAYKIENA